MVRRLLRSLSLLAILATPAGCIRPTLPPQPPRFVRAPAPVAAPNYDRELAPGERALRKLSQDEVPDLQPFLKRRYDLARAVKNSLHYLAKSSSNGFFPSGGVDHERVVRSLQVFANLLDGHHDQAELADLVRRRFDVYTSVGCDDKGTVLFTGYYTPIFDASRTPTTRFRYPLHLPPKGHVKDLRTGATLGIRRADGSIDADYPSRSALLGSRVLRGRELVYLESAFEAYVIGVQGSAHLRLTDGATMQVAYAGNNGHPYSSIGKALIREGKLKKEELNLRKLISYFREHPGDYERLAATNARYVFFQTGEGGPRGCLNEPVLPLRSLATDKGIFPRGALCMIEVDLPLAASTYRGMALDQDAGGAIRAPGRCDIYMGIGDAAGELAGHTYAEGRLYYLLLKNDDEDYAIR